MFFCEKCRVRNKWFTSFGQSYGRCEICGKTAECHDVPSKYLPPEQVPVGAVEAVETVAAKIADKTAPSSSLDRFVAKARFTNMYKTSETYTLYLTAAPTPWLMSQKAARRFPSAQEAVDAMREWSLQDTHGKARILNAYVSGDRVNEFRKTFYVTKLRPSLKNAALIHRDSVMYLRRVVRQIIREELERLKDTSR